MGYQICSQEVEENQIQGGRLKKKKVERERDGATKVVSKENSTGIMGTIKWLAKWNDDGVNHR